MTVKELEEKFEILSQQFEERIQELSHQSVKTQELLRMIGKRLGRMEANNVGQQQPIHRNQFPIGLRPQQAEGALVQPRNIRIAFPIFSGDNPSSWVFRCEQYQRVTALTEAKLLSLATVHLEGDAVPWYQWLEHSMGQMTWEQFKRALQTRFGSLEEANAGGTLSKLRQTGTVKDYQLQFERLANRIRDLPESFLISCFLSGLRDDIKVGGSIKKHSVTILVDSGSTHNFLNPTLAKQ
ncbi:hypothetical protein ACOSQ4_019581 [Xanthoceras sorbifolium]